MATKKTIDRYANIAAIEVIESAANTQTSKKFNFPFSVMDKMGLLISRIEYWPRGQSYLNGSGDVLSMAITAAATLTDINDQSDPLLIDSYRLLRVDAGTAATAFYQESPFVKDFSELPGGGILVAPAPLYAMIEGIGLSNAGYGWFKLFYTYMELAVDEYWQLVESRRVISD